MSFYVNSTSITKYDVFQKFKTFGPLIRCFVKNKENNNPYKKGFVKFRKVENALKLLKLKTLPVKDSYIYILPNPKVHPNLLEEKSLGTGDLSPRQ